GGGGALTARRNLFGVAYGPFACRDDLPGIGQEVLFLRIVGRSRSACVMSFLCRRHCGAFCKALASLKAPTLIGKHTITSSSRSGGSAIGLSATVRLGWPCR